MDKYHSFRLIGPLGDRLYWRRMRLDASQRQVARLAGLSKTTVAAIENGRRARPENVAKVATALHALEIIEGVDESRHKRELRDLAWRVADLEQQLQGSPLAGQTPDENQVTITEGAAA